MRELRFVRLSEDGSHLVVTAPQDGELFGVPVEPALLTAVGPAPALAVTPQPAFEPAQAAGAPEPAGAAATPGDAELVAPPATIVPREVQVRVRSGESPEEVAASLGVEPDRILRFALPVVDERHRIAHEARRARARHTAPEGTDSKVVVFGEAVDARYTAHGLDPATVDWDSYRRPDGEWVVVARWLGGENRHEAEWVFHRVTRSVTPADDTAADLLSDRPIRPIAAPPVGPRLVVAPPLVPGVVAFPPMPDAHTGPIERIEEVFDQEATGQPVPTALRPALVRDEAPSARPEPHRDAELVESLDDRPAAQIDFDAPPLPLGIAEPEGRTDPPAARRARREPSDEDRAARARIPSWDDILLGVRRKSD